jgi:hypothetical protein
MSLLLINLINKIKGYVINFFSHIAFCFIFKPITVPDDARSSFEILVTPFVNWFRKFKECFTLICKDSLINSLLNFYKLFLSLLMACLFFIMYFAAYTAMGFVFSGAFVFLLMCTGVVVVDLASPEGPLSEDALKAIMFFRHLAFIFSFISSSSLVISTCAKIPFLRVILIDTVGSLSYKFYVGENPGSIGIISWASVPRLAAVALVAGTGMSIVDQVLSERQLNLVYDLSVKDGQVMTVAEKSAFFEKSSMVRKLSKGAFSTFASSFSK